MGTGENLETLPPVGGGPNEPLELSRNKYTSASCVEASIHCVPSEYVSIQAAVDIMSAGETVLVFTGSYSGFEVSKNASSKNNPI